jgi:cytosine/adenosine deaminase-related metal-dependent hydrolase
MCYSEYDTQLLLTNITIIMAMSKEQVLSGTIIYGDKPEVIEGYLCIEDNIITEIGTDTDVDAHFSGVIAPCFVNAHTHIGDSVLKDPPILDLDSLVKPPMGLKHRVLRLTPDIDMKHALRQTLLDMINTGTCTFCDYREGGIPGASILIEVLDSLQDISGIILGRPQRQDEPHIGEPDELAVICNGIGISGANDVSSQVLEETVDIVRRAGKIFSIHAGEKDASDIPMAIELRPDFLVHMTHAQKNDLSAISDADIPVVVCPRSNLITGVGSLTHPPIQKMLDMDIIVGVGTDNVMLNSVNMFAEMEFLSKVYRLDDGQVFKMCTLYGATLLGLDQDIGSIMENKQANIMVLNNRSSNLSNSHNLLASIVRRGRPDDIVKIIRYGREFS